ncbi:Inherit from euNOG: Chromosome 11 open reading frame 68 [Seminavis robusta]|uniref:Inherit from euNOG: Chromosome 11 open reading frame 68 n=1 Tax=Seminavis robusta TaxID=568900 RepID=A0A9N8HAF5_9STRA|nr:Inherit from euNOG: Chromosome 11 open reading frame 68 [Seminavis robusta]|eukprot:Sro318_g115980.1 Inherit from euNOG: Chromosome 11 open reading frame 68 (422) ;mRNA; f:45462-46727
MAYKIKLVYSAPGTAHRGNKKVDVESSMTLEDLAKVALEEVGCDNVTLSLGKIQSNDDSIDWKGNPSALVWDVIPKLSIVYCTGVNEEAANTAPSKKNNPPRPEDQSSRKKPKTDHLVVDLLSSDEDDEIILDDPRDPTKVVEEGEHWIFQDGPKRYRQEEVLGKWLLFRKPETISNTWKRLAKAVKSGQLHAASAKVATHYNSVTNPNSNTSGPQNYVICVYTSEKRLEEVGLQLIHMVKHIIRYKRDQETMDGIYATTTSSNQKVSYKTLYWNAGKPSHKRTLWTGHQSRNRAEKATAGELSFSFDNVQLTVTALKHYYYKKGNKNGDATHQTVQLVREPDNRFDANAIQVQLSSSSNQVKLGYLARKVAELVAPWLDESLIQVEEATVVSVAHNKEIATIQLKGRAHPDAQELLDCLV